MKFDPILDHLVEVNRDAKAQQRTVWWHWLIIVGCGALLGWWLITVGQNQQNPGPPPKVKQMRAIT